MVKLRGIETENEERQSAISKLAIEFREFVLRYADAMLSEHTEVTIEGEWECNNAKAIEVKKLDGDRIEVRWTDVVKDEKYRFKGKMSGRCGSGEISK